MATTPTLPLFDGPATPSTKRWPDDKRGSASDEERQAHIERWKKEQLEWAKSCDPVADLRKPWWETLTEADSHSFLRSLADEIKARYEREAQQAQSLAADLDPFDELDTYDFVSDGFVAPVNDGW